MELKTHGDYSGYKEALPQAARYGLQLGLKKIYLIFLIEEIDYENRRKLEAEFSRRETAKVVPLSVETGE